jgi:hypothetical protein
VAWVLALCCFFFYNTSQANAQDYNYNNHTFGHDVDYYKDTLLGSYEEYVLTDWQWFPGTGEQDGDTTNDHFCLPVNTGSGYEIWYGQNGSQSCGWWGDISNKYQDAMYKDFFADLGTVKMDCSNELNDPSCPGYQEAHFSYMCSTNPLYDQNCPGYQQAYYDQQCSANPLYDQNCPGYANAYYTNQCSADPLYDSGCQGYQEAYAKQMNEQKQDDGSGVDDGSGDGVPANDGSDIDAFIEPEQTAEDEQQTQGFDDGSNDGGSMGVKEEEKVEQQQEQIQQQQIVIEESKPEVIEQQIIEQKIEVQQEQQQEQILEIEKQIEEIEQQSAPAVIEQPTALEEANSLDLDSMSPLQVIGALNKLGILGNSATNGVGDPTGLSNSIEGTGGTISATGQTQIPGAPATGATSSDNMGGGSMSMGDDGSMGDTGMGQQDMNGGAVVDGSSGMPQDGSDFGGGTNVTSSTGVPETQYGFGTVNNRPDVGANGITNLEADMGLNINPLFENPALSSGVSEIAGLQEERYSTLASRIIRDRIRELVEVENQIDTTSAEDAEELVQQSIEQSIENKMDELMVDADVNQAEIIVLMGVNLGFSEYENQQMTNPDLYKDQEFYIDKNIPQNRSALRNGLAQQILHDKMVDMQYEKMNEEKE